MTIFELPINKGKPLDIVDFEVDLLSSPPAIKENLIEPVDNFVSTQTGKLKIGSKKARIGEGRVNIYICRLTTGKYLFHIFGKIRGEEFHTEKEIAASITDSHLSIQTGRIRYVLISSRNILRKYYMYHNLKSIKDHLTSFLLSL